MKLTEGKFAVILLAAGKSSRFKENKLLANINNKPMIDHSLDLFASLDTLIKPIIVVTGAFREEMHEHLKNKKLSVVFNPFFETGGMISSIQTGLNELKKQNNKLEGIFIHPADVPFIETDDVKKMIDLMQIEKHLVVVPLFNNHRGHPILINNKIEHELEKLEEESEGLRGFLNNFRTETGYMITQNSDVRRDIDYKSEILPHEK